MSKNEFQRLMSLNFEYGKEIRVTVTFEHKRKADTILYSSSRWKNNIFFFQTVSFIQFHTYTFQFSIASSKSYNFNDSTNTGFA